ncbi:hypothetical protein FRC08_012231, partial [Ceratobasidium sp. 394]
SEWERRGAHEEEHSLDLPAGPPPPAPSPAGFHPAYAPQPNLSHPYSYSRWYRPVSSENVAAVAQAAARRHAEEIRRYHEHLKEIKYRERQAARAVREAFWEEHKHLDEQSHKAEEEKRNPPCQFTQGPPSSAAYRRSAIATGLDCPRAHQLWCMAAWCKAQEEARYAIKTAGLSQPSFCE